MARPFDDRDFKISKIFSISFQEKDFVLTNACLYDFATFIGTGPYTITIPNSADLPRSLWPIGAYGFFNNSTGESIFMTPAADTLLNDQSGTIEIFDGTNPFATPCFLVRVKENDWHVYCPAKGGTGGGNVTGTGPTVVGGLAVFNTTDGTGIQGQTNLSAETGNDYARLRADSSATDGARYIIRDDSDVEQAWFGQDVVDSTIELVSELDLDIVSEFGLMSLSASGGIDLTTSNSTDITLGTSGTGGISLSTGGASGDITFNTNGGDVVIQENVNVPSSGEFINIDQATGSEDIGIQLRDNTQSDLARFYWDESQVRSYLDITGNTAIESSVQLTLNGQAECAFIAGLSLTLEAGDGLFIGNNDTVNNVSMFNMVSAGPNGGREDVYYYDGNPDGNLQADFGYSLCWVTDTTTPANTGWWLLNTASNSVNTPWVQIASVNHTTGGIVFTGTPPVENNGLLKFSDTTGEAATNIAGLTTNGRLLKFDAQNGTDTLGSHFYDTDGTTEAARLYYDRTQEDLVIETLSGGAGDSVNIISNTSTNITAGSSIGLISTGAGGIALTTTTSDGISLTGGNADTTPMATFANTGGNNATVPFHTGSRNPNGNVNPGGNIAFYAQSDGSGGSELWINDQNNINTWVRCKGRGGPVVWGNNGVSSGTTDRYLSPGIDFEEGAGSNVDNFQWVAPRDGFMRNMRIRQNAPAGNGNDIVYTLRQGTSNTALTVTVASTSNNGTNTDDIVTISEGNLLNIEVTKAASVNSSPNNIICTIDFL